MTSFHFFTLSLISLLLSTSNSNPTIFKNNGNPNFKNNGNFYLITFPTSFSTQFSFSLLPNSTLSLYLTPQRFKNSSRFLVNFEPGFVKIGNLSVSVDLKPGVEKYGFVDYWVGSGMVEVYLGSVEMKPKYAVLVLRVDLCKMWKGDRVLVGFEVSSNNGFLQEKNQHPAETVAGSPIGVLHSWKFKAGSMPKGMHSIPVDLKGYERKSRDVPCYLTVVSALMITVGCCVFVVFMVMFLKVVFTDWEEVLEMEYMLKPVGTGYKVVGVDVESNKFGNVKCVPSGTSDKC